MMDEQSLSDQRRRSDQAFSKENNMSENEFPPKITRFSPFLENETTQSMHVKSRVDLGSASSFYFKHLPKTPLQKEVDERLRLNASMNASVRDQSMMEDQSVDFNLDEKFAGTVESEDNAEISFASIAASTDSSSAGLNRSVLSDTTELTASNFVLRATLHHRLKKISNQKGNDARQPLLIAKSTSPVKKDISPMRSPLNPLNSNILSDVQVGQVGQLADATVALQESNSKKLQTTSPYQNVNETSSEGDPKWREVVENIVNLRKKRQHELVMSENKRARHHSLGSVDSHGIHSLLDVDDTASIDLERQTSSKVLSETERAYSEKSLESVESEDSLDVSRRSLDELLDGISGEGPDDSETASIATSTSHDARSIASVSTHLSRDSKLVDKMAASTSAFSATDKAISMRDADVDLFPSEIVVQEKYSVELSSTKEAHADNRLTVPSDWGKSPNRKKLTPSRIRASPVRMLNPDLTDSPARNTRSAKSRRQSVLVGVMQQQIEDKNAVSETLTSSAQTPKPSTAIWMAEEGSPNHGALMSDVVDSPDINAPEFARRQSVLTNTAESEYHETHENETIGSPMRTPNESKSTGETSSSHKKLTPSKIRAPPIRVLNPELIDSPARNTRGAKSRRQSLLIHPTEDAELNQDELEVSVETNDSVDPVDSPARNTRTAVRQSSQFSRPDQLHGDTNNKPVFENEYNLTKSPLVKEKSDFVVSGDTSYNEVSDSLVHDDDSNLDDERNVPTSAAKGSRPSLLNSSRILNSSLRKPGTRASNHSARKKVAFGSPDIVEFNASSPSMNLTPATIRQKSSSMNFVDDTVEIDADMNALLYELQNNPRSRYHSQHAGCTPMTSKTNHLEGFIEGNSHGIGADSPEVSQASRNRDTSAESITIHLEQNLEQVVETAVSMCNNVREKTLDFQNASNVTYSVTDDAENTVALEVDMATLLDTANGKGIPSVSEATLGETSLSLDERNTVELEGSIQEVLQVGGTPLSADSESRKGDSDMEEDNTVELEEDFHSFLELAPHFDKTAVEQYLAQDSPASTHSGSRRRSSLSSQRFSLVPETKASISHDGFDEEIENTQVEEESSTDRLIEVVPFDLTGIEVWEEIVSSEWNEQAVDLLMRFSSAVKETDFSAVTSTLNEVFELVCQHLNTVPELELDRVLSVDENCKESSIQLQNKIRSKNDDEFTRNLGTLARTVQSLEDHSWQGWLISVIESLREPLEQLLKEVAERSTTIQAYASKIGVAKAMVSSVTSEEVRRARLKSYHDCQTDISELHAEIAELEAELAKQNASLRDESAALSSCETKTSEHIKNMSLEKVGKTLRLATESAERSYHSLFGMSKVKPVDLDGKMLKFLYQGMFPHTSIVTTFHVADVDGVHYEIIVDSNVHRRKHYENELTRTFLQGFTKARIAHLIEMPSSDMSLRSTEISGIVRRTELMNARVEILAMELVNLSRRYRASLHERNDIYELEVEFGENHESAPLRATFEISLCYPFAPLNVCLDSFEACVDIDCLRKVLLKNAKPGFGYLSRSCDVIATHLRMSRT